MGKNPAFQFYPADWSRDLEEHPLEIEGAWIRICCKLWWSDTRGKLTRSKEQWARILRVDEATSNRIIFYIKNEGIGNVTLCNDNVTVISRRMHRDYLAKECTRLRVQRHRNEQKSNTKRNGKDTPCTEGEVEDEEYNKGESEGEKVNLITERFDTFWKAYPKKIGKAYCLKIWEKLKPTQDLLTKMLDTVEKQKDCDQWNKDNGQYIPNPSTWLNQGRWDDEVDDDTPLPTGGFSL